MRSFNTRIFPIKAIIISALFISCQENPNSRKPSKNLYNTFVKDTIHYDAGWSVLKQDYLNSEDGFVARFVNYSTKSQYYIKNKIQELEFEKVPDGYYLLVDSIMLSQDPENKLLEFSNVEYRNEDYDRRVYLMNYKLKGWYKQISYTRFDSGSLKSIQFIYKLDSPNQVDKEVPEDLINLDEQFKFK